MFHGSDIIATHLHQREKTLLLIIVGFATMDLATIPDREPGFLQHQLPYFECHGRDNDCPIFNTCKERPWVLQWLADESLAFWTRMAPWGARCLLLASATPCSPFDLPWLKVLERCLEALWCIPWVERTSEPSLPQAPATGRHWNRRSADRRWDHSTFGIDRMVAGIPHIEHNYTAPTQQLTEAHHWNSAGWTIGLCLEESCRGAELLGKTPAALDNDFDQWFAMTKQFFLHFHSLCLPTFLSLTAHFVHWIEKRFHNLWPNDLSAQRYLCLPTSGIFVFRQAASLSSDKHILLCWTRCQLGLWRWRWNEQRSFGNIHHGIKPNSLGENLRGFVYFIIFFPGFFIHDNMYLQREYVLRGRSAIGQSWGEDQPLPEKCMSQSQSLWSLWRAIHELKNYEPCIPQMHKWYLRPKNSLKVQNKSLTSPHHQQNTGRNHKKLSNLTSQNTSRPKIQVSETKQVTNNKKAHRFLGNRFCLI